MVGPFVGYALYLLGKSQRLPLGLTIFTAVTLANLATYVTTSVQLVLAFPDSLGGFAAALAKFLVIFAVTQLPLAVSEGLLTVLIFNFIQRYSPTELVELGVTPGPVEVRS